ncbi:MAG: hypothetical protein LBB89_07495 [Treponema sp.]|jgi:hypothetical protein|nr:hypothetical protein [Treponema sp.]
MKKTGNFKLLFSLLFIFCITPHIGSQNNSFVLQNENYWKNIAEAGQILIINTSELSVQNIKLNEYYEYDIQIMNTLKGAERERIQFNVFMKEENYDYIMSLAGTEKVIVFLINTYDGYGYNNYLANYFIKDAIIKYTDETERIIVNEIYLQDDIINNKLYENFNIDKRLYARVNRYINNTTNILFEHGSFKQLEKTGEKGVPYIILLMNNFKTLPVKSIRLENKSKYAFEAYRHYSPELVIDALTAILNQITGEDFGSIYNGEAAQEERILALNGWRIYLYKLIKNP